MKFLKQNLTQYEHMALNRAMNLADGHAHQRQNCGQNNIIDQLTDVFYYVETSSQAKVEKDFQESFFRLAGQLKAIEIESCLLCYSASEAIEMAVQLLKQRQLRLGLIEPVFDNLHSLVKRAEVNVIAIDESLIFPEPNLDVLSNLNIDAIFIVLPNNPTGNSLRRSSFKHLIDFCAENHKLLIIDFCFRFFEKDLMWDQYAMAIESGIDFIFVEDTGKTWSILDLKAGLITVNDGMFEDIFRIHNDLILNVSPFILELLRLHINISIGLGLDMTVTNIVDSNRNYLRNQLKGSILRPVNLSSSISVEWLEILHGYEAEEIWKTLKDKEIYVLPGTYFYWQNLRRGAKYIRIALMRDTALFREAVDAFVKVLPPA